MVLSRTAPTDLHHGRLTGSQLELFDPASSDLLEWERKTTWIGTGTRLLRYQEQD